MDPGRGAKKSAFAPFIRIEDANAGVPRNLVQKAIGWALKDIRKRKLDEPRHEPGIVSRGAHFRLRVIAHAYMQALDACSDSSLSIKP